MKSEPGVQPSAMSGLWAFLSANRWRVASVSLLLLAPCWWHRHIEAGDLGSHVYNVWLAQLIAKGQAPGLYLAGRWNNVLFDVTLLHVANVIGLAAAQKVVVSGCVLVFFWGVFAFVAALSGRFPWVWTPAMAMLAYGYVFNMGFFNYYLSIGLGCFCLALVWRPENLRGWTDHLAIAVVAALTILAHPLGPCWIAGVWIYRALRKMLPGWWVLLIPAAELALYPASQRYLVAKGYSVDWYGLARFYEWNGVDQLMVYGERYRFVTLAALAFIAFCLVAEAMLRSKHGLNWNNLRFPIELYVLLLCTTAVLPENLRFSVYQGWIGLLVTRLTLVSAIAGLAVLSCANPRWWHAVGCAAVATLFFVFLYQDTGILNRLEANAEKLTASLSMGTRIIPTIEAPDWRVHFVVHTADRACVGKCFVFSNYEPSSEQFRVRVAQGGSRLATDSAENAEDMQGGEYEIEQADLPLKQIYQCDRGDWIKLCVKDLVEGENTGKAWVRPDE